MNCVPSFTSLCSWTSPSGCPTAPPPWSVHRRRSKVPSQSRTSCPSCRTSTPPTASRWRWLCCRSRASTLWGSAHLLLNEWNAHHKQERELEPFLSLSSDPSVWLQRGCLQRWRPPQVVGGSTGRTPGHWWWHHRAQQAPRAAVSVPVSVWHREQRRHLNSASTNFFLLSRY